MVLCRASHHPSTTHTRAHARTHTCANAHTHKPPVMMSARLFGYVGRLFRASVRLFRVSVQLFQASMRLFRVLVQLFRAWLHRDMIDAHGRGADDSLIGFNNSHGRGAEDLLDPSLIKIATAYVRVR